MPVADYNPFPTEVTPSASTPATNYGQKYAASASPGPDSAPLRDDNIAPDIGHDQTDAAALAEVVKALEDKVDSLPAAPSAATTTVRGLVKEAAAIANLTAAPTMADFNGLLAAMRAAGLLAAS